MITLRRLLTVGLLSLGALGLATTAQARSDVFFSVGVTAPGMVVGVGNVPPVYVTPAPVYVQPMPIYPAPLYSVPVYPAPVYYNPPRRRVHHHARPGPRSHGHRGHAPRRGHRR